jgi:hypothetical protein
MSTIRRSLLVVTLASFTAACGMVEDPPGGKVPSTLQPDSGIPSTNEAGVGPTLQKPAVDPLPNTVCSDTVPVQGSAVPGTSVFVMGGLSTSGIATDAHPTTGRFCLDVPLKKNGSNTLEVRAQDPTLGLSEAVTVVVSHSSCKGDAPVVPPEEEKSENVALGIKGKSSQTPNLGNEGFLTDGKSSTVMELHVASDWYCPVCDVAAWTSIKLEKLTEVEKIVVKWRDSSGNGTAYGKKYKVLVSSMSDPGDPSITNGYWTAVGEASEGDGGIDSYDLKSSKPLALHVAIFFLADASGSVWNGWYEYFAVSELEVWDAPKKTTPTPSTQTNTCANVGSGN